MKTYRKKVLIITIAIALLIIALTACTPANKPSPLAEDDGPEPALGRVLTAQNEVTLKGIRLSDGDVYSVPFALEGVNAEFAVNDWIEMCIDYVYSGTGGKLGVWLFPHRDIAEYSQLDMLGGNAYFCEYEFPYETYPDPLEDGFILVESEAAPGLYDMLFTWNGEIFARTVLRFTEPD